MRLRSLLPTTLALAALAAGSLAPAPTRGQAVPAIEDFDGTWAFASGRDNLEDAIDHVVDELNLFIREIARLEMRRRITPERQVRFIVEDAQHVALAWDDWGPHRLDLGGARRSLEGPEGSRIAVSLRLQNGRLVHHHAADSGARYTTYSLSGDRQRMTMAVRITSDQLPVDIRYRLQYRRQR